MRRKLTTAPAVEPIDLAETKLHCKITTDADDDLITALIIAARGYVESYLQAALITQTWTLYFDADEDLFSKRYITLPVKPLISITSLKTFSDINAATVFANTNYLLSGSRVLLNDLSEWPSEYRLGDSLEVVVVAGYGPAKTDVPQSIRLAMKMLVLQWYEKREALYDPTETGPANGIVPFGVTALLSPFRNYYV